MKIDKKTFAKHFGPFGGRVSEKEAVSLLTLDLALSYDREEPAEQSAL